MFEHQLLKTRRIGFDQQSLPLPVSLKKQGSRLCLTIVRTAFYIEAILLEFSCINRININCSEWAVANLQTYFIKHNFVCNRYIPCYSVNCLQGMTDRRNSRFYGRKICTAYAKDYKSSSFLSSLANERHPWRPFHCLIS